MIGRAAYENLYPLTEVDRWFWFERVAAEPPSGGSGVAPIREERLRAGTPL